MAFSKTFPKTYPGTNYPVWEEITLTNQQETEIEEECRKNNFELLDQCLLDAKSLAIKNAINTEDNVTNLAIALFEKRASHVVFWKENKAKELFDKSKV
jgi:hypothetical protein